MRPGSGAATPAITAPRSSVRRVVPCWVARRPPGCSRAWLLLVVWAGRVVHGKLLSTLAARSTQTTCPLVVGLSTVGRDQLAATQARLGDSASWRQPSWRLAQCLLGRQSSSRLSSWPSPSCGCGLLRGRLLGGRPAWRGPAAVDWPAARLEGARGRSRDHDLVTDADVPAFEHRPQERARCGWPRPWPPPPACPRQPPCRPCCHPRVRGRSTSRRS